MANKVVLQKEGYIYEVYDGDQDGATVQDMIAQTTPLVQQIVKDKKPVLILADIRTMNRISLRGRQAAGKALLEWPYLKIAVFGANLYMRHIGSLLLMATNKGDRVRLFKTEAEAKIWLLGGK